MRVLEQYGFLVNSTLSIQNNNYFQRSTIKVKTDSLYAALKDLKEMGILISENITVKDYTNSVRTRPATGHGDSEEPQRRETSSIANTSIRDQVEWSTISLDIRGTEKVYPEQKKESLLVEMLRDVQYQLIAFIRLLGRNFIGIVLITVVIVVVRKTFLKLKLRSTQE